VTFDDDSASARTRLDIEEKGLSPLKKTSGFILCFSMPELRSLVRLDLSFSMGDWPGKALKAPKSHQAARNNVFHFHTSQILMRTS
jgi:hypothetical protein